MGLAVALLGATAMGARAQQADTASAASADTTSRDTLRAPARDPASREGRWAIGALAGWGWPTAEDFNDRIELENLALASAIPTLESFALVQGAMRYGIRERLAIDLRAGYLWESLDGGRIERSVSAIPIVIGITAHPWGLGTSLRLGLYAGGGVLYDAAVTGVDPLGGVDESGNGWLAEAGFEAEYSLFGPSGTVRARAGGEIARVAGLLGDDSDLVLDGFLVQLGILYYLPR